jgi:translation elongation factor EF-G
VHLEKCLTDLRNDFAPGIEFTVGEPMIPFKETIFNRKINIKVRKQKEELGSEGTESSDEENFMHYMERQLELERNRELLRKETATDMYIEKIFFQKLFREDPSAELKTGYRPCTGDELTAN